ncbi:MAG: hypothetical protein ABI697_11560 [Devosia sp.]
MRELALGLLFVGTMAFLATIYRHYLPYLPIGDGDLKIIGGALLFTGIVGIWFPERADPQGGHRRWSPVGFGFNHRLP